MKILKYYRVEKNTIYFSFNQSGTYKFIIEVIDKTHFTCTLNCEVGQELFISHSSISNLDCKLVYVSSEYVFSGNKGNYTVDDRLDPINVYGKTKAAAEYIASTAPNYQIIRAPFIRQIYPKVFTDQYCSRYFLKDAVGKIINNIFKNEEKIVHISSERMSLYDLYIKNGITAEPITMSKEQKKTLPKDTSLINNSI